MYKNKTSLNITLKSSYPINVDGKNVAINIKKLIETIANSSNELKKITFIKIVFYYLKNSYYFKNN
jgi:hypothetical protein